VSPRASPHPDRPERLHGRFPTALTGTGQDHPTRRWAALILVGAGVTLGVLTYLLSPNRDVAPIPALRQLDLLYLNEPAPGLDRLGVEPGTPAVIVFCEQVCDLPEVTGAQVVLSHDPVIAERYALRTSAGRVGPGYALVDPEGQLRYRTFDPAPGRHASEIQVLVDAVQAGG
jgi:hypothetical protein